MVLLAAERTSAGAYSLAGHGVNLYETYLLPTLIDLAMRSKIAAAERARLVPRARGTVLEVGIGSGLNLPFYGRDVERLVGLDPSPDLWTRARRRIGLAGFPIEHVTGSAERIPLETASVDTVVVTWTLCSIADAPAALAEMRRVLKPDGRLLFAEHGLAPDTSVARWQARFTPLWRRLAGGCHLDRDVDALIGGAGFRLGEVEREYRAWPRPMTYFYRGVAWPDESGPVDPRVGGMIQ
jgi:SAM-dependent methyltransferase